MITRIFDKSRPINFLIVFFITLLVFVALKIDTFNDELSLQYMSKEVLLFSLCLATLALVNFVVSKNNLTQKSSYKILLFSLFFAMIPFAMNDSNILLSNLFILLALRRILSLRSLITVKRKLFDASVLIAIASLFYFWSILFIVLVFAALLFYSENKVKNWIVPFVGLLTVSVLYVAYHILRNDSFGDYTNLFQSLSFDFKNYNDLKLVIGITVLISFGIWASIFYINNIKKKLKTFRPSYIIILFTAIIALGIVVVSPNKNGSEFLFLFAPLSVILTSYMEVIEEKWFKELFLIILIAVPLSFQFF